jgi:hypothetical protein
VQRAHLRPSAPNAPIDLVRASRRFRVQRCQGRCSRKPWLDAHPITERLVRFASSTNSPQTSIKEGAQLARTITFIRRDPSSLWSRRGPARRTVMLLDAG